MDLFWVLVVLAVVAYFVIGYVVTIACHALWYTIEGWSFDREDAFNPLEILFWAIFIPILIGVYIIPAAIRQHRNRNRYWDKQRKPKLQVRLARRGIKTLRKVLPKSIVGEV